MNFLKRLFSKREQGSDNSIIKSNSNLTKFDDTLSNIDTVSIGESYSNRLSWWNNLPDEWKRLLMMKSNLDDPMKYDISKNPSEALMNELFQRNIFHSMWQRINTLKPLTAFKKTEVLIIEFIKVKDFSEISGMTHIKTIIADNSKIESLEGLENFENLKKLTVCNTDVNSLKPIATLKNLQDLDIRGTLIHPQEYEFFKQLHPKTNISFITPMNPLRRGKESLENPLLDYYRSLLEKDEKKEEILFNEGVRFSKNKQYTNAISKFNEVLSINSQHINSYIERGFAKHNSGNIDGAIKDFDAAIENSQINKELLFYYRGRLYAEINKNDEAIKNYYLAIKSNPSHEESYIAIKEVYLSLGNIKGAIEILNKLVSINSSNINYYFDLGIAYGMLNDFIQVIKCMDKVLDVNPNDSEALYNRGASKLNIGQQESGIRDIKKSSALGFRLAQNSLNKMGQK